MCQQPHLLQVRLREDSLSKIKLNELCRKTPKLQLESGSYWDFCEHSGKVLGFLACLSARYDIGCSTYRQ